MVQPRAMVSFRAADLLEIRAALWRANGAGGSESNRPQGPQVRFTADADD